MMTDKYHERLRQSKADYEQSKHRIGHACGTQFARIRATYGQLSLLLNRDFNSMPAMAKELQLGEWQLHEVVEAGPDYVTGFLAGCRSVFEEVFGRDAQYQPPETD